MLNTWNPLVSSNVLLLLPVAQARSLLPRIMLLSAITAKRLCDISQVITLQNRFLSSANYDISKYKLITLKSSLQFTSLEES